MADKPKSGKWVKLKGLCILVEITTNVNRAQTSVYCLKFTFLSSCDESWGGSEELWSGAALALRQQGHDVSVYKTNVEPRHTKIARLVNHGCVVRDLRHCNYPLGIRLFNRMLPVRWHYRPLGSELEYELHRHLDEFRPDLCVVSQGENFDGVHLAALCGKFGGRYAVICQKASDFIWPNDQRRSLGHRAYRHSERNFFVARKNLELTEHQLGFRLDNAEVISNPSALRSGDLLPWPQSPPFKLACVARLWVQDKGQDILLNVLARPVWRERELNVSLVGGGVQREALLGRANQLKLRNVAFLGQQSDLTELWREHHGLILPSRAEGTPLAAIEAMVCGRPCILTDVGGNSDLIDPQVGFLAHTPTEDSIHEALECAWNQRMHWETMGQAARLKVQSYLRGDPIRRLADKLLELARAPGPSSRPGL